jgi:protocatechuate 3,4-dioxygenase beta subunit
MPAHPTPDDDHHNHDDEFDRGFGYDLSTFLSRRRLLTLAGGAVALAACGKAAASAGTTAATSGVNSTAATDSSTPSTAATSCDPIPEETAGPFPGDGSNGPNVLTEADIVRSDIRSSIGSATGVAEGVPLTVRLTLTDTAAGCVPLAGAAVYLWHCDRDGNYSMYSEAAAQENYLRGVQESDADGNVTFLSIFPACYSGRWPHIHFEVHASVDEATGGGEPIATSQLAFPADVCDVVYATEGYEQSVRNLGQLSLASDNVFGDDQAVQQLATVTGDVSEGYLATLAVAV